MSSNTEKMISILGSSYLQPIADLIDKSLKSKLTKRNAVIALHDDNIYSVSIILLSVLMVESYCMRISYFNPNNKKTKRKTTPEYVKSIYPGFRLEKSLTEAFVARDSIAHNHLWTLDFKWRPMSLKKHLLTQKVEIRNIQKL